MASSLEGAPISASIPASDDGDKDHQLVQFFLDWLEEDESFRDASQAISDQLEGPDDAEEEGCAKASPQLSNHTNSKRKERNKIFARETRQRKKCYQEALQSRMVDLISENRMLKTMIKEKLSDSLQQEVLSQCVPRCMPPETSSCASIALQLLEKGDYGLISAIQAGKRSYVITDPKLPDNSIIYASPQFLTLTGYSLSEVVGRNCRFLQGPGTDARAIERLREDIQQGVDSCVCLLNYRRDGSTFLNQVFVTALRDVERRIIYYVGVQVEVKMNTASSTKESNGKRPRVDRTARTPTIPAELPCPPAQDNHLLPPP